MISLKNISKSYINLGVKLEVLKDLNCHFSPGEIVSIVGTNGSGKTTLLRIIAGLLKPDTGLINLNSSFDTKPLIGIVYQNYLDSLFPWRTVHGNIHLSFEISDEISLKQEEQKHHIDSIIDRFGISEISLLRPGALSGGQAQIVAIARALVHPQIKVLLMDEPFSSLDGRNLQRAASEIIDITRKNGVTTLVITHDIDVGILLGDKIAILTSESKGIVKVIDSPVKSAYNSDFLINEKFLKCKKEILSALYPSGEIK